MCVGVGEADWAFKTNFDVSQSSFNEPNVDLVFEGLDTYASVTLVSFSRLDRPV